MKFYKRFPGDITVKTGHLTLAEFGAYDRLLDHYYATEQPIPANRAYGICRAQSRDDRAAVDGVLTEFFELTEAGWVQGRAEEVIAEALPRIEAARENGKKGGRPRKPIATEQKPTGFSKETQAATQGADPEKASQSQSKKELSNPSGSHPAGGGGDRFDAFWLAYPRKVGKDAARKAFAKRKPSAELLQSMLAALTRQRATEQWQRDGGQYIPHPSTWLNEGRWQDEALAPGQGAGEAWHESRQGIEAKGVELGLGGWDQDAFDHGRGINWLAYKAKVLRAAGMALEAA